MAVISFVKVNALENTESSTAISEVKWRALRQKSSRAFMQRDFDAAMQAESKAMEIAEALPANSDMLMNGLHALATLYRLKGMPTMALPLLDRAVSLAQQETNPTKLDVILFDLAEAYRESGRDSDAEVVEKNRKQTMR